MTDRDIKILCFIAIFGKSYADVIAKTFFAGVKNAQQVAKNRITLLANKYKVLEYAPTGAKSPRNYIVLTQLGREIVIDADQSIAVKHDVSIVELKQDVLEQIVFYWLEQIGGIERPTDTKKYHPDFIFSPVTGEKIYVEIETHKKSATMYQSIFKKYAEDGVDYVLYVVPRESMIKQVADFMPLWARVEFITVDALIDGVHNEKKINSENQILIKVGKENINNVEPF